MEFSLKRTKTTSTRTTDKKKHKTIRSTKNEISESEN